jgi:hypothetical protein
MKKGATTDGDHRAADEGAVILEYEMRAIADG